MFDKTKEIEVNEEIEEVEVEEKQGLIKSWKDAISGKIEIFKDDHPKMAKAAGVAGKVIVGAGLLVGGFLAGNAIANRDEDDYPGYDDDEDYEFVDSDVNDAE